MKLVYLFKNLVSKINASLNVAKDYTDKSVEYEDFSAQMQINSTYFQAQAGNTPTGRRVGNVCYINARIQTKTSVTDAMNRPLFTLPYTVDHMLVNMVWFQSASDTRPLIYSSGNNLYLRWSSNISSGVLIEFIAVFWTSGGVIKALFYKLFPVRGCYA